MEIYVVLAVSFVLIAVCAFVSYRRISTLNRKLKMFEGTLNTTGLPVVLLDGENNCFFANSVAKAGYKCSENDNASKICKSFADAGFELSERYGNEELKAYVFVDTAPIESQKAAYEKEILWLISILDSIDSPISVTNKNMEWTFINRVVEQMLGVKRADVVGKQCSNWGAGICKTENCGINCLRNGKDETRFSQFGSDFSVHISYLYDEKGEVSGHVEVVRDISDITKKSAEFEVKAHWYESILDAIPFPISVTDTDMKWTFINRAVEGILNVKRSDIYGRECSNWGAGICKTGNCGIVCAKKGIMQTKFSQGDLVFQVDVAALKDSSGKNTGHVEVVQDITKLESTIAKMNILIKEISAASSQVALGVKQIAESSQNIAEGTSSQASSIQELNASIELVNGQIQQTAENAINASELSKKSRKNALKGNEEMKIMVSAMEGIKDASDKISKIIKTIENIAFQTNLLALNAAVEAAKAGSHGKGFTVVAEEVRNLASASQAAAEETNSMIIDSIRRVEEGTKIAVSTANSLDTIVSDFENVSRLIDEIAQASTEQKDSMGQINIGITQISNVVQANSATSEESAAAAQQIASQAETLQNLVMMSSENRR